MDNRITEILNDLNKGKINTEQALNLIRNIKSLYDKPAKKSSKIKITIKDKENGKNISLPAIPF